MDFCLILNFFIGFDACKYIIWLLYFYISDFTKKVERLKCYNCRYSWR